MGFSKYWLIWLSDQCYIDIIISYMDVHILYTHTVEHDYLLQYSRNKMMIFTIKSVVVKFTHFP